MRSPQFSVSEARLVFTPSVPARLAFIDREKVNDKLVTSITTPGKQVVVYGHSGSGKTTLLENKLQQLYEGHIVSRCMKGTIVEELIRDAFDQLDEYYVSESSNVNRKSADVTLEAAYAGIKHQIKLSQSSDDSIRRTRYIPPELKPPLLAKLIGGKNLCWVIEDFHKVDPTEKVKLSQIMKIFMDTGTEFPDVKIIALGAVETARQVVEYDPEMRNRVAEIEIPLMSEEEIKSIMKKGAEVLNIVIPPEIQNVISKYSSGLAAVCHQLCLNMCDAAGITITSAQPVAISKEHLEKAITKYVEECSDSIRNNFEKARKVKRKTAYQHADLILEALSSCTESGVARSELLTIIKRKHSKYTDTMLKGQLVALQEPSRGELVRYSQNSGLFMFSDPVYRVFAKTLFHKNGNGPESISVDDLKLDDMIRLIEKELSKLTGIRAPIRIRVQKE